MNPSTLAPRSIDQSQHTATPSKATTTTVYSAILPATKVNFVTGTRE
jgi:hypothetical protein